MSSNRVDNFTDAAFAFAVTLLVIGGTESPTNQAMLTSAVAEVPAFAIGFTFIAMFWFAHLRWRKMRGDGDWLSAVLSVLLVFLVLIYVQPMRAMARSLSSFLGGSGRPFEGDLGDLFLIYGAGFIAMAAATAALFAEAQRNPALDTQERRAVRGEMLIWVILLVTGIASIALAPFDATEIAAPMLYATLPISIGLFVWRYDWVGSAPASEEAVDR
jgi:uncharacterized membrane protein